MHGEIFIERLSRTLFFYTGTIKLFRPVTMFHFCCLFFFSKLYKEQKYDIVTK